MNKKQLALLDKTACILDKLAEKCGGVGGTPGPCPGPKKPPAGAKPRVSVGSHDYKPDKDPTQSDKPSKNDKIKIKEPPKRAHVDSMAQHLSEKGKKKLEAGEKITREDFTPERQALHKQIIDSHFEGKTPVKEPIAYVLGGGPASGKSSIIKAGHVKPDENTVHVDADAIKGMLPEYQTMVKAKDAAAAAYAHEESSFVAKEIQDKGSKGSYNTLLDGTGNSTLDSLTGKIKKMKAAGQKVVGAYVTVPTEVAIERNRERAKKTGRLPPESMLRACHKSVSAVLPKAIEDGLFDEVQLFDTSNGVKQVASAKGGKMQIHDQGLWNTFKAKANE